MEVVRISSDCISIALDLALEVFMEYEAPVYSQEGIDEFKSFIDANRVNSKLSFYGAYEVAELVGMIAIRDYQHISLFFIKTAYQRKGIGRLIFNRVREDYEKQIFTVNSSPYAVDIYKRLGFMPISAERITNGIKYTPMVLLESERLRLKRYEIDISIASRNAGAAPAWAGRSRAASWPWRTGGPCHRAPRPAWRRCGPWPARPALRWRAGWFPRAAARWPSAGRPAPDRRSPWFSWR